MQGPWWSLKEIYDAVSLHVSAGPFDFGEYPFSFNVVKQFIFIRHGEKVRMLGLYPPICRRLPWCCSSSVSTVAVWKEFQNSCRDCSLVCSLQRTFLVQPPKEQMTGNLSDMSIFRANNLYRVLGPGNTPVGYDTPDVIYAMKAKPVSSLHFS